MALQLAASQHRKVGDADAAHDGERPVVAHRVYADDVAVRTETEDAAAAFQRKRGERRKPRGGAQAEPGSRPPPVPRRSLREGPQAVPRVCRAAGGTARSPSSLLLP